MNKELLKFCRVYRGEKQNPLDKSKDEFRWYMWCAEFVAVHAAMERNISAQCIEDFMKQEIKNSIDTFASEPFGGDPLPYYDRYFSY